jgi:uncharacterized protein YdhG (YjbR/CyaY superfamily)
MKSSDKKNQNINEYIYGFPNDVQKILRRIRETIQKVAPKAKETISYQIPTFKLNGNLVHFAAFKNHIGFYPTSSAIKKFSGELTTYNISKGTIRFPLDKKIPLGLISKITRYRVKENLDRSKIK